jgi:hypothetical protein
VSFLTIPLSILGWIYDPDHSLRPGMYVDVPHEVDDEAFLLKPTL